MASLIRPVGATGRTTPFGVSGLTAVFADASAGSDGRKHPFHPFLTVTGPGLAQHVPIVVLCLAESVEFDIPRDVPCVTTPSHNPDRP